MKCSKCSESSVSDNPALCKEHFISDFESRVKKTINEYNLLSKKDKVCVAVSGGKDSMSLLHILKKKGYNVEALALDEGIKEYRDATLSFLKDFCSQKNIPLNVYSYKKEVGKTVDELSKKYSPACTVCGTFRRHLLNKYAERYDKIATGHNLDDEAQAIMMNILNAQTKLFSRQGPKTSIAQGFVQKVKPFYHMKEKEIMIYSLLNGLNTSFKECPYAHNSFRFFVRSELNKLEAKNPGTKENIINKYLSLRNAPERIEGINICEVCMSPCSGKVCKACRLQKEMAQN